MLHYTTLQYTALHCSRPTFGGPARRGWRVRQCRCSRSKAVGPPTLPPDMEQPQLCRHTSIYSADFEERGNLKKKCKFLFQTKLLPVCFENLKPCKKYWPRSLDLFALSSSRSQDVDLLFQQSLVRGAWKSLSYR